MTEREEIQRQKASPVQKDVTKRIKRFEQKVSLEFITVYICL